MRAARIAALSLIGAAVAIVGPATAVADPATGDGAAVNDTTSDGVTDYWTSSRMENAVSLDINLDPGTLTDDVKAGAEVEIDPTLADSTGDPWTGGGDVVNTAGRVFFKFDGKDASCSGNAVTSDNGNTVLTAGHCVKYQGAWHTDWVFVPGYHDGQAPFGEWPASKTLTTPQWEADEDMNYDVGAAVVEPQGGKSLTDTVGGQGVAFNGEYNQKMYAFGFPAADPYDGEKFIYCGGTSSKDVLLTQDHSLPCDMTGGSSGGPWFREFDEATGTGLQSSVNSFGYKFLPNVMFGPYFGDDAKALYDKAAAA
ncbi:trypsin-like serine peptidase [Stackebrandtia nassauensis]|uniref:Peptidase n=1 Tax=Stackebrandtia nassauensis (strain DSM 44728 / CIP 108903 / NRRL B-16338 / NBRC 102104 / LLR-40K-21) TaxID=446470 RepID=D3PYC2_STANL|nr:peptidase [Stackebrandtia nassauensis]ADD41489.1 hypothetical protein Snas_1792 [Stackebrandtia nassauensis DSM 44728]